jgi:phage gp36-like protein
MAYSTKTDILEQLDEAILVQLTDDESTGLVNDDRVTRAIASADAAIDSYCQGRFTVPLSPIPDKIRDVSVDLAIYNLYSRREDTTPETRKDRYKEGIRFLEKVAEGKINLGAATPAPVTTGNAVDIEQSERIFTRDKMTGF